MASPDLKIRFPYYKVKYKTVKYQTNIPALVKYVLKMIEDLSDGILFGRIVMKGKKDMLGVELIFLRRFLLLLPLLGMGIIVKGQQTHAFNYLEQDYRLMYRWLGPVFPPNSQANNETMGVELSDNVDEPLDKLKILAEKQRFMGRVSEKVYQGADAVTSSDESFAVIKYSSSPSSTGYRVALDRKTKAYYRGRPGFVDAKGVKYIIDSKFEKQIVK